MKVLSAELQAGSMFGEYRLERRLGTGGFGNVWLARDASGGSVAVKVLRPESQSSESARLRAEIELLAASASSQSPHIVRVLGGGSEPAPHVVMEYIEGTDLADEIVRRGAVPVAEVVTLATAIADALGALQRAGIIHRDVKPANVMLAAGGTVKLTDFGIAKIVGIDTLTSADQMPMSMAYAAPEVWEGKTSHLSDHYAFGALLYHCLAGRPPFEGTYAELYRHHLASKPDLDALPVETPPSLRRLIGDCLEKDASQRPQAAAELKNGLVAAEAELARDATVVVPRLKQPEALGPWVIEGACDDAPWTFRCRHESTGEQALVELHFSDDLDYGQLLRHAVAVNEELVPLGAERLLGSSRFVLRPGEAWRNPPPAQFQFWVAREAPPDSKGQVSLSPDQLQAVRARLFNLIEAGELHDLRLDVADRLALLADGSLRLRRPGLPPFRDSDLRADAEAFLQSLLIDYGATQVVHVAALAAPAQGSTVIKPRIAKEAYSRGRGAPLAADVDSTGIQLEGEASHGDGPLSAGPFWRYALGRLWTWLSGSIWRRAAAGCMALIVALTVAAFVLTGGSVSNSAQSQAAQPASFYVQRGMHYYDWYLYDLAMLDFNQALAIDPRNAAAYHGRGKVLHSEKNEEQSLVEHNKAIELEPRNGTFYAYRGNTYRGLKQSELALADYNKALELNPREPDGFNGRGNLNFDAGRYDLAVVEYTKAIEIEPLNSVFYRNRGSAYKALGRSDLARADFEKARSVAKTPEDIQRSQAFLDTLK